MQARSGSRQAGERRPGVGVGSDQPEPVQRNRHADQDGTAVHQTSRNIGAGSAESSFPLGWGSALPSLTMLGNDPVNWKG